MQLIKRISIYIREMFPLQIYVPFALVSFFGLFFVTQVSAGRTTILIDHVSMIGAMTVIGVMLIMRILDDFKDIETDARLFPERPLLRGAVAYSDVRILGIIVFTIICIPNIFLGWVIIAFISLCIFCWLTFKWFFLKELISNNLILALITHQPVTLFVNAYVVCCGIYVTDEMQLNPVIFLAVLLFFFPLTAWETSRKIRAEGKETEYVTYSKLFGPVKAAILPFFSLFLSMGLAVLLGAMLDFEWWFFIGIVFFTAYFSSVYIRFMIKPIDENLKLRPVAEYVGTLTFILLLIQIIVKYNFEFSWL